MSDADDPTESTPTTEPVDAVEDAPAPELAAGAADPVRTVTRKGAAVGMAGALLAGGLIGWLGAGAFDDDDTEPISAFQEGPFGEGRGPGGMPGGGFPGGGMPGGGMPGGGMPGGGHGPGGGWGEEGDHPMPPWMDDEDGDDRRDDHEDESEDQGDESEDQDLSDDATDGQGDNDN